MLKKELSEEEIKILDDDSNVLFKIATSAFSSLEILKILVFNLQITLAHLGDSPDTRALGETAKILNESIIKLEGGTGELKDLSKKWRDILNE